MDGTFRGGGRETPSRLALLQGKGRHAYVESAIGFVSNFIEEHGKGVGRAFATSPEHIAEQAVLYALARLSEHEAAFSHEALLTTALTKALGETTPHYLNAAITQAAKTGALVKGHLSTDGIVWTTKEALAKKPVSWKRLKRARTVPTSGNGRTSRDLP